MRRLALLCVLLAGLLLPGPAAAGRGGFDLFAFFAGTSVSEGTVTTLLVRREAFTARFSGERAGDAFRLEERFAFEDGPRLQVWTLRAAPGGYVGTVETEREDGTLSPPVAVSGTAGADGVVLTYVGFAPGGGGTRLAFRHHMRLAGDGTVENRVVVSKFGLPLATSVVTFAKTAAALPSASRGR